MAGYVSIRQTPLQLEIADLFAGHRIGRLLTSASCSERTRLAQPRGNRSLYPLWREGGTAKRPTTIGPCMPGPRNGSSGGNKRPWPPSRSSSSCWSCLPTAWKRSERSPGKWPGSISSSLAASPNRLGARPARRRTPNQPAPAEPRAPSSQPLQASASEASSPEPKAPNGGAVRTYRQSSFIIERPSAPRLHLDCVRFAGRGWRLGRHAGSVHVWFKGRESACHFAWFRQYCSSMALTTRHKLIKSLQTAFPARSAV